MQKILHEMKTLTIINKQNPVAEFWNDHPTP